MLDFTGVDDEEDFVPAESVTPKATGGFSLPRSSSRSQSEESQSSHSSLGLFTGSPRTKMTHSANKVLIPGKPKSAATVTKNRTTGDSFKEILQDFNTPSSAPVASTRRRSKSSTKTQKHASKAKNKPSEIGSTTPLTATSRKKKSRSVKSKSNTADKISSPAPESNPKPVSIQADESFGVIFDNLMNSDCNLGKVDIPFMLLSSPDPNISGEFQTRDFIEEWGDELTGLIEHQDLGEVSEPMIINICETHDPTKKAEFKKLTDALHNMGKEHPNREEMKELITTAVRKKICRLITVDGQHRRYSYLKLIKAGKKPKSYSLEMIVMNCIPQEFIEPLSQMSNKLKSKREVTSWDRVVYIRKKILESGYDFKSGEKIPHSATETIVKYLFLGTQATAEEIKTCRQGRNPLFKGCLYPSGIYCKPPDSLKLKDGSFDSLFRCLLEPQPRGSTPKNKALKSVLTISDMSMFYWYYPNHEIAELLVQCIQNARSHGTKKAKATLKKRMGDLKFMYGFRPALVKQYKKLSNTGQYKLDLTDEEFTDVFFTYNSLDSVKKRFPSASRVTKKSAQRDDTVITGELIEAIKSAIRRYKVTVLPEDTVEEPNNDQFVVTLKYNKNRDLRFFFKKGDCVEVLECFENYAKEKGEKVGLVHLDWPYGCLKNVDWDVRFSDKKQNNVLGTISIQFPDAVLVIHDDINRLATTMSLAQKHYNNVRPIVWYRPNQPLSPFPKLNYTTSIILLCSHSPLRYIQRYSEIDVNINPIVTSNLVTCSSPTKRYSTTDDGTPLNCTEKPIELLRGLLYNHCEFENMVVDLCSGSGSMAIACASLGYNYCGVDKRIEQIKGSVKRVEQYETGTLWRHPQDIFFIEKMIPKKLVMNRLKEDNEEISSSAPQRKKKRKSTATAAEKSSSQPIKKPVFSAERHTGRKRKRNPTSPQTFEPLNKKPREVPEEPLSKNVGLNDDDISMEEVEIIQEGRVAEKPSEMVEPDLQAGNAVEFSEEVLLMLIRIYCQNLLT